MDVHRGVGGSEGLPSVIEARSCLLHGEEEVDEEEEEEVEA